jgi:hypothetical protein
MQNSGEIAPRECRVASLRCHAPLQARHPVRRGLPTQALPSLEYLIARSSVQTGDITDGFVRCSGT